MSTVPNALVRSIWDQQEHRCGVKLRIIGDPTVSTQATIGGLIQVGGTLFGLTVAHVFPILDSLPGEYGTQISGLGLQQHSSSATDRDSDSAVDDDGKDQGLKLRPPRRSMVLDWALVDMSSLEDHYEHPDTWSEMNLVQTTSGNFRPVLVAPEMPPSGTPVVLATPGSVFCLRGILTGEEALVNVLDSLNPYITWVLRMEQPWLIQPGDSGSWAFDAGSGDLLGILVVGCPQLHEAYIIPAHEVFGHIRDVLQQYVRLPNCYPVTERDHRELSRLENAIAEFKAELEEKRMGISVTDLERIDIGVASCISQAWGIFSNNQRMYVDPESMKHCWVSPSRLQSKFDQMVEMLGDYEPQFRQALESLKAEDRQLCEDVLLQSPLGCFNFICSKIQDFIFQPFGGPLSSTTPTLLWGHLMLGERSFGFPENDVSTAGHPIIEVIQDEQRSCRHLSLFELPRDRNSIMAALDRIQRELEHSISLYKRYFEATFPEKAHFGKLPYSCPPSA
ncbi:hypothetical protein H9Q70_005530 [Fusarium xylarioides]|nr:hypothetical protein H9Q70_005530 [Fusarium xylarioides]KAG5783482.1 hypothetical protein H9Q73_002900 [Fusarium xylarioides]